MNDWLTCQNASDASRLRTGMVASFDRNGVQEWRSHKWLHLPGTYRDTIQIRAVQPNPYMQTRTNNQQIYAISGNPAKFLQGHNCFGPPAADAERMLLAAMAQFPPELRPGVILPDIRISRTDINVMVEMGNHDLVHEWLEHAQRHTRSRTGRAQCAGSTVWWGSKGRWEVKVSLYSP